MTCQTRFLSLFSAICHRTRIFNRVHWFANDGRKLFKVRTNLSTAFHAFYFIKLLMFVVVIVADVRRHTMLNFHKGLVDFRLCWKPLNYTMAPTIAGRYSHSAIVHANSMYVFGGGSSTETTFNDLWRFDLSSRTWVRPIAMGSNPSPKACATMVCHKNNLILFGGWRHPSAFPLYQPWRLFDELHSYSIAENKWLAVTTLAGPPPMTGHSATVHKGKMVVFGGYCEFAQDEGAAANSNDVWSLDLSTFVWTKKETNNVKPAPRYGQFQIQLDDEHFLVLGGCGGPNNMFNDAWVLDMTKEPWVWRSIVIKNKKWAASHMWCNPACKVRVSAPLFRSSHRTNINFVFAGRIETRGVGSGSISVV